MGAGGAAYDEMVDGTGRLRPRWRQLIGALAGLGPGVLAERNAALDAMLADEGSGTLLPGGAPAGRRLDPLPLIIQAGEFRELEAGLAQRARLLNAILEDVYGPGNLLAAGLLPSALVHANPAFLRACRAVDPGTWPGPRLHLYAADLLRDADGTWRVLADRCADAAGIGYAMLNRRALVRVMPELFRSVPLRRLSPFFELWQDALERAAPSGGGDADPTDPQSGMALLTPGPGDKLWYEHVILARELSCALVEAGDLTARDGVLFLKTLRGLRRVDVLIRRQDGRTLDPLELEPGRGVTGLMDAARWGGVRLFNDPGAGFVEAPGLAAFLPRLAGHLLGEELRIASLPALWLGDPRQRAAFDADPTAWRLRCALDGTAPAIPLAEMPTEERQSLMRRAAASPAGFAAVASTRASLAPWVPPGSKLQALPVVLRCFLVFDGTRWRALPGGLARAVTDADLLTGRLPLHSRAKDVWIAADEQDFDILGPAHIEAAPVRIRRATGDLPSRVADNFYWLGRYLERLDAYARLLRTAVRMLQGPEPTPRELAERRSLASCFVAARLFDPGAAAQFAGAMLRSSAVAALLRHARPDAPLPDLLGQIARLAGLLRDRLTGEVHDTLMQGLRALTDALHALPTGAPDRATLEDFGKALRDALTFTAAIAGLTAENMVRGGGRIFVDLGRRLERAQTVSLEVARLLDQPGAADQPGRVIPGLRLALELRDSVLTYRSRYLNVMQPAPMLDLVLADEDNPRSLAYQVTALRDLLGALAQGGEPGDRAFVTSADAMLAEVQAIVRSVAASPQQGAAAAALPPRLEAICRGLGDLSDAISRRYFALLPAAHTLGVEQPRVPEYQGSA